MRNITSPLAGFGSPFGRRRGGGASAFDPDAAAYISAVETADGQALESGVKTAINDFVVGCKADASMTPANSNFSAIRACCIWAASRTLSGALIPVKGPTPTNINFVSGDYARKIGLKGNRTTKRIDTNYRDNAHNEVRNHLALDASDIGTTSANRMHISTGVMGNQGSEIYAPGANSDVAFRNRSIGGQVVIAGAGSVAGFYGSSRTNGTEQVVSVSGTETTYSSSSAAPIGNNFEIYGRAGALLSDARIRFYSVGADVDIGALRARVNTLMTALDGAIA